MRYFNQLRPHRRRKWPEYWGHRIRNLPYPHHRERSEALRPRVGNNKIYILVVEIEVEVKVN